MYLPCHTDTETNPWSKQKQQLPVLTVTLSIPQIFHTKNKFLKSEFIHKTRFEHKSIIVKQNFIKGKNDGVPKA